MRSDRCDIAVVTEPALVPILTFPASRTLFLPSFLPLSLSYLYLSFCPRFRQIPQRERNLSWNSRRFSLSNEFLFHDVSNELYNCEYSFYRQATNSTIPTPRVSTNGKRVGEAEGRAGEETRYPFPRLWSSLRGWDLARAFVPGTRAENFAERARFLAARARAPTTLPRQCGQLL